jgi:superfamily II DNA/RNA helicase
MNQMNFSALGLSEPIQKAIDEMGFSAPTPIQQEAIPAMRKGADVIGRSQTGTGKTLAFALRRHRKNRRKHRKTLRAGAGAIARAGACAAKKHEQVSRLAKYLPAVRTACLYGGAP